MIFHVLHEVKEREEEYQFVKDLATRIGDLLPSVQLAKRERRLLWHGEVACIFREPPDQVAPSNIAPSQTRNQSTDDRRHASGQGRSGSLNASLPSSSRRGNTGYLPSGTPTPTPAIVLSPCPDVSDPDARYGRYTSKTKSKKNRLTTVHCFAFTDVLILAEPLPGSAEHDQRWKLFADIGMSRVLGVTGETFEIWCSHLMADAS